MIGTGISSVASSALTTAATGILLTASGSTGVGVVVALFLAGGCGLVQGAVHYSIHYTLEKELDTTAKKVMALVLQFLVSTFVIGIAITSTCPSPIAAAFLFSAVSFPISIAACLILGNALLRIGNVFHRIKVHLQSS